MGRERQIRKARRLQMHAEYGAYLPAMMRSAKKLKKIRLSPRNRRRNERLNDLRIKKLVAKEYAVV